MKATSTVGDLERLDGTIADTDVQKAEVLNSFFASVFTTEGEGDILLFEGRAYNTELVDLSITKENIECVLKTLDTSKSPGPDGLHPRPLAEMAEQLAEPFQALFSTSLEEVILPQGWKDGNVTPIFKKGRKLSTCQLDVDTVQSDGEVGEERYYGAFDQQQLAVQVPTRLHQGSIVHYSASSSSPG